MRAVNEQRVYAWLVEEAQKAIDEDGADHVYNLGQGGRPRVRFRLAHDQPRLPGVVGSWFGPSARDSCKALLGNSDRFVALVYEHIVSTGLSGHRAERPTSSKKVEAPIARARGREHHSPNYALGLLCRIACLLAAVRRDDRVPPDIRW